MSMRHYNYLFEKLTTYNYKVAIMADRKESYTILNPREHVLKRPDTYIGNVNVDENIEAFLYEKDKIVKKIINSIDGFNRIHFEIFYNSIDNILRSTQQKSPCKYVSVNITENSISVSNDGLSIPIEQNSDGIYIPEVIFGQLMSGSNFNDKEHRYTTGRNGLGAKLTNIFSKEFIVEIHDPNTSLLYKQRWFNNMCNRVDPVIEKKKIKEGKVIVSWTPDFEYFGLDPRYTDTHINLFKKIACDIAGNSPGCIVYFNETKFQFKCFLDYYKLYNVEHSCKERIVIEHNYIESLNAFESTVIITPNYASKDPLNISFINNLCTPNNGKHYSVWYNKIIKHVSDILSKKFKADLATNFVKNYFNIVLSCKAINPQFTSQNKVCVTKTGVMINTNISLDSKLSSILKWKLIDNIKIDIKDSNNKKLDKLLNESKKKTVIIEGYDAANYAGSKKSNNCTLFLIEGLSAKPYAVVGLNFIDRFFKSIDVTIKDNNVLEGRDWIGIYPLKGVPLNSRTATYKQLLNNKELTDIIKIVNLERDVDYLDDVNYNKLNYGRIVILTDADCDGNRIKGLLINFFHGLFPSLLNRNFLLCMQTPILKLSCKRNSNTLLFYNEHLAKKYIEQYADDIKTIKYYKGLGTSNKDDIKMSWSMSVQKLHFDEDTDQMIEIMFSKNNSDDRKKLIEKYNPVIEHSTLRDINAKVSALDKNEYMHITVDNVLTISNFIKNEMVEFSKYNCERAIPSIIDGLKLSHRKILYGIILKNSTTSIKVAQLSGYISEKTNYHHGEQNLCDTIIKMAQSFVGANNIPLLYPDGQFGCLSSNTMVRTWGGVNKLSREICVGDVLVGDDHEKRTVILTTSGYDDMYKIKYEGGYYTVNASHILTLYSTKTKNLHDIHIKEYLKINNEEKQYFKGIKENKESYDIAISYVGVGRFHGWQLEGNNSRFVLGDGTITHNSRIALGADAASPRYIYTKLNKYTRILFNPYDDNILEHSIDDGDVVEPKFYIPIIPNILVNGCKGIATGFSTDIINFNPMNVIEYIKYWLINDKFSEDIKINPWYKGFKGTIVPISSTKWESIGTYEYGHKKDTIVVTEIPVLISITEFKENLDKLVNEKKITSYLNYSREDSPHFIVKVNSNNKDPIDLFYPKSKSTLNISNMVLFDVDQNIKKFSSIYDIIEYYSKVRYEFYKIRKEHMINIMNKELTRLSNKLRFITLVIDHDYIVFKKKEHIIVEYLTNNAYDKIDNSYEYLLNINVKSFTYEMLDKLTNQVNTKKKDLEILIKTEPKDLWLKDIYDLENILTNDNYMSNTIL